MLYVYLRKHFFVLRYHLCFVLVSITMLVILALLQKCDLVVHQWSSSAVWPHLGVSQSFGNWMANNVFLL